MKTKTEHYQSVWDHLDAAKRAAREQLKLNPETEYFIIESIIEGAHGKTKGFYVENTASMVRAWETEHGYFMNGKHHK